MLVLFLRLLHFLKHELNNPVILKNGVRCSDCKNIFHNKDLKLVYFEVDGFSEYLLIEDTPISRSRRRCVPDWECSFGSCINNQKKETCVDLNNCGTLFGKPVEKILFCVTSIVYEDDSEVIEDSFIEDVVYDEDSFIEDIEIVKDSSPLWLIIFIGIILFVVFIVIIFEIYLLFFQKSLRGHN